GACETECGTKASSCQPEPDMPIRGPEANWLKGILPEPVKGAWWECPPDGQGYRLKLRWRGAKSDGPHEGKRPPKHSYVFKRLRKHEADRLKEMTYDQQRHTIKDRILGELFQEGRRDVALRLKVGP